MKSVRNPASRSAIAPRTQPSPDPFASLTVEDLRQLADRLLLKEASAISACIDFIEAESKGLWHGRARAMMCRRLKHCSLSASRRSRLVACITGRLRSGRFSEQFVDQLRLAMRLDERRVFAAARACASDQRDYVRRYADWVIRHPTSGTRPSSQHDVS